MSKMNADEIVRKDRDTLYIGNLNTVEFDLVLPLEGPYGSSITWKSGHDRFLTTDGKITRPTYGMGDRLVDLTATFTYEDAAVEKIYEVTILQEANKLKVSEIYPVHQTVAVGKDAYLIQAAIVCTEDGDTIAHPVEWEEDGRICFEKEGVYQKRGVLTGTSYEVTAFVNAAAGAKESFVDNRPKLVSCSQAKIRLLPGSAFYDAQERMKEFLMNVDDDQMLYNFRYAAGLDTKGAPVMEGWDAPESQLRGHTTGHYMSALALCYRATGDEKIKEKAIYMIDAMEECQNTFESIDGIHAGFLSGYSEEQFDLLEQYTVYPIIWAPYYTLHKLFAGFLDCYRILGLEKALKIADRLGMWTYRRLSRLPKSQLSKMWSMYIAGEFGGMNAVMAELYQITGKEEFLKCAKLFDNEKLFYPLEQGVDAISTMHANQHIPQVIGAMEIFKSTGEKKYYDIAKRFWEYITESRIYATGGTGEGEMFHERNNIAGLLNADTQESCASYNMMKLTKELYLYDPDVKYMDYYERTMTNHILATIDETPTGESTYFLPLGPGMKREFLYENSCCHGTGMENHFKYAESIYFLEEDTLYINTFIPNVMEWDEKNISVKMTRDSQNEEVIHIIVKGDFKHVKIRKPYWTQETGYITFSKDFSEEKEILVNFPYTFAIQRTKDNPKVAAVSFGPYILAALSSEEEFLKMLFIEESIEKQMHQTGNAMEFEMEGVRWVPLYKVGQKPYHVYVQCDK